MEIKHGCMPSLLAKKCGNSISHKLMMHEYDVLARNWTLFFRFMDVQKRGEISRFSLEDIKSRILATFGMNKQKQKELDIALAGWWQIHRNRFGNGRLISTKDDYILAMKSMYTSKKPALVGYIKDLANSLFDVMDYTGDGLISRKEFLGFMRVMGATNEFHTGRIFEKLDTNSDGVLEKEEYRNAMVLYHTDPSPDNYYVFMFKIPGVTI